MRRALVLTAESARHPFRRMLPAHVLRPLAEDAQASPAVDADTTDPKPAWRLERSDLKDFLTAYGASCVAVMVFFF